MTSIDDFASITPVSPPIVNRNTNPNAQRSGVSHRRLLPCRVAIHLNTFIPVGTAIIIVAAVKYARVSTSIPTVNIWWAQTRKPRIPMETMAYTMPRYPKGSLFPE